MKKEDQEKIKMFYGFSKLKPAGRYKKLLSAGFLNKKDIQYFKKGGVKKLDLADKLIENVIGYFQLPLGVAANFVIDGKPYLIPMAVEETSIVASASKTARWISEYGSIKTSSTPNRHSTGQIQIHDVKDFPRFQEIFKKNEKQWIQDIHRNVIPTMVKRGGGVKNFSLRKIDHEKGSMAVIHVFVDTCDAMGANAINQICEYLKKPIEQATEEEVSVCILSNLSEGCLTQAQVVMKGIEPHLMEKIEKASIFAENDTYRAATSNKGVMNGISSLLIATGNDYRAVEAGVHAYSSLNGGYRSVTKWRSKNNTLCGFFEAPLMVGIVGGMTTLHPTAKICMNILGVQTAAELARVCAAVGLVQNLGAIRALTTVGIIEGHIKLHIKNLTQSSGASGWEFPVIQKHLESLMKFKKRISLTHAIEALKLIRNRLREVKNFKTLNKQKWARDLLKDLRKKYASE